MDGKTAELLALGRALYVEHPKILSGDIESIEEMVEYIATARNADIGVFVSGSRKREYLIERQLAHAVCRTYSLRFQKRWSLEMIGGYIGSKDHSTVVYSVKTVWNMMEQNDPVLGDIDELIHGLGLYYKDFEVKVRDLF